MKKFLFFIFCLFSQYCFGSITIDSLKITQSSCQKNGSITIYAKTDRPPMVYSILEGPEVRPAQSGNSFTSLAKGIYKVLITNFSNDSVIKTIDILSNYVQPDFSFNFTNAFCNTSNDGTITGFPNFTNRLPLKWVLTNITKGTTITQNNGNFSGLSNDSYSLRLYDSCQNFITKFVDLSISETKILDIGCNTISFNKCNEIELFLNIKMNFNPNASFFGVFDYNGTQITKTLAKVGFDAIKKEYTLKVILTNITYNTPISISLFNHCNENITFDIITPPFQFSPIFNLVKDSCTTVDGLTYIKSGSSCEFQGRINYPVNFVFKDVASNTILISGTYIGDLPKISAQIADRTYQTIITDMCGDTFKNTFIWPRSFSQGTPFINISNDNNVTLDSTTTVTIEFFNFINPKLEIISAPPFLRSTKPRFRYLASYDKTKIILPNPTEFKLNLGVGSFRFRIFDNCNNELFFDLVITPNMVGSVTRSFTPVRGCLNNNLLIVKNDLIRNNTYDFRSTISYKIYKDNVLIQSDYFTFIDNKSDSLIFRNLLNGTFVLKSILSFLPNYIVFNGSKDLVQNATDGTFYADTVIIPKYFRPEIKYVTTIECNGDIFIELIPDIDKGLTPYKYEVISGPILYPLQSSNLFTFRKNGIYIARIQDVCGNANTFDFTVDTLIFPPIFRSGSFCQNGLVKLAYPTSVYFTYKWERPDGTSYIGDTLYINNASPLDTGLYVITRYVDINGCKDSVKTTYTLQQNSYVNILLNICKGDTTFFYGQAITEQGTYIHLIENESCDSIITLKLQITNPTIIESSSKICKGDTLKFYGQVLTTAGLYSHTKATVGCDSIFKLDLQIANASVFQQNFKICKGDSIQLGSEYYSEEGNYFIKNLINIDGCDSSVSFVINYNNPSIQLNASSSQGYREDSIQLFSNNNQQNVQFFWSPEINFANPNVSDPFAFLDTSRWFYVKAVSENGCISMDSIFIEVSENCKDENIYIPNAFTPNGDGINDVLRIKSNFNLDEITLIILNRNGEKVFETNQQTIGWDGMYKGKKAPNDVYAYYFKGRCNGLIIERKGNITLLAAE